MNTKQRILPIMILAASIVFLFAPLLFFGKIALNEERIGNFYPLSFFYDRALSTGTSPLWNPHFYGGFPAFADLSLGLYNPFHYLAFVALPALGAHHLLMALGAFAGLLAAYWFGRASGFSTPASLILAYGYLISHTLDGLTMGLFAPYSFLAPPAMFLAVANAHRAQTTRRRLLVIALGGIVMSLVIMSGHPQMVLYGIIFAGAYALFLGWRTALAYAAMAAVAALLALPQLAHTLAIAQESIRTVGYATAHAPVPPPTSVFGYLFPISVHLPFLTGQLNGIYTGTITLILAAAAAFYFRNRTVKFFLIAYAVLFALAARIPVIREIHDSLPLFSRLPAVGRWLPVGAMSIGYLAAHGYDELRRRSWSLPGFVRWVGIFCWSVVGLMVVLTTSFVALDALPELKDAIVNFLIRARHLSGTADHYRAVFDTFLRQTRGRVSLENPVVLLLTLLWPAAWFVMKKNIRLAPALAAATALIALGGEIPNLFVARAAITEPPQIVSEIKKRESDTTAFRILPVLMAQGVFRDLGALPPAQRALVYRETLTGELPGIWGIDNLFGIEPMRSQRQHEIIDLAIAPQGRPDIPIDEQLRDFVTKIHLLSEFNVKYVASWYELPSSTLRRIPLATNTALGRELYLYENPDVLPRIRLEQAANGDRVEVVRYLPGDVEVRVTTLSGGRLILSESLFPGWTAAIDGQPAAIERAVELFQAVSLPPGTHTVRWTYHNVLWQTLISNFQLPT